MNNLLTRLAFTVALGIGMVLCAEVTSSAQMTDSQVVEYVKKANKAGKSQTQIASELLAKGVTEDQLLRIKDQYTNGAEGSKTEDSGGRAPITRNSMENDPDSDEYGYGYGNVSGNMMGLGNTSMSQIGQMNQTGQTNAYLMNGYQISGYMYRKEKKPKLPEKDEMANYLSDRYLEDPTLVGPDAVEGFFTSDLKVSAEAPDIFGHDIFLDRRINFEPNENAATPIDYRLGPNDEVIIDIWGYNEASIRETITPEGMINIEQIGPVYLNGLTVKEASEKIKKVLGAKYSGIDGDQPNTEVSVSLGQIRTILVNVMGEVYTPGAFRLSPFSTVFTALYRSGGVSPDGTMRNIKLVRGDKVVAVADIYGFIFSGDTGSDIRLQDGDVIIVPAYGNLVKISGYVKRPMYYEMKEGEPLSALIDYAGGFTGNAYTSSVNVYRRVGSERSIASVSEKDAESFALQNGDEVRVAPNLDRFSNLLEVRGCVFHPGLYELGTEVSTVRQLIEKAGGLKEDAFLNRAVIHREKEDLSFETVSVPLGDIMSGASPDIELKKNDLLVVNSKFEIEDRGTLTINGSVANPGTFPYAENTTVEDLILQAGGLIEGASLTKVDISRRFVDPYGIQVPDKLGETFTFSIKDGLIIDGGERFALKPYDVVSVRRSPSYQVQQFVTIEGEVVFPGEYVLQSKSERLSSVIQRAGGLSKYAYLRGGLLTRQTSKELLELNETTKALSKNQKVATDSVQTRIKSTYTIGINMEKALLNPGSIDDIILMEGDKITIPENSNIVSISGEVLFPNVVIYQPGKSLNYYISQAGGYTEKSKRSRVYVVYMNGNVSRAAGAKFEPGCQIVVPSRRETRPLSVTEVMSMGTSAASLATMIVSIVNMIK